MAKYKKCQNPSITTAPKIETCFVVKTRDQLYFLTRNLNELDDCSVSTINLQNRPRFWKIIKYYHPGTKKNTLISPDTISSIKNSQNESEVEELREVMWTIFRKSQAAILTSRAQSSEG